MHSNILDKDGHPIKKQQLTQTIAKASVTGVRNIWNFGSIAGNLTPDVLATTLRDAENADADAQLTLAEEMEEREMHYAAVISTRKRAVTKLPVEVEAHSESEHDQKLAQVIRDLVAKPEFRIMKKELMDGLAKAYSVVEMVWDSKKTPWTPSYEWRDPRFFKFDKVTGRQLRLKDDSNLTDGIELPSYKFIVHRPVLKTGLPIRGGLARLAAVGYMCKSYALTDWLAFAEVFGMPIRVGRYGKNASEDDIRTLVNAVANIGSDAAAAIPDSMNIEFIEAKGGSGGADLFEKLATWLDKQISKAVLGQTMTTDDGSSQSQANVHNEVRQDIQEDDAQDLADTLNRDFVRAYIDINFGTQDHYPKIVIEPIEQEDSKLLSEVLKNLVPIGLTVKTSEVRDRIGFSEPDDGDEILGAPAPPPTENTALNHEKNCSTCSTALNREAVNKAVPDEIDNLEDEYLNDWQKQLEPVVSPLITLAGEVTSMEELLNRLPELEGKMDSSELVKQLAEASFKARVIGDE